MESFTTIQIASSIGQTTQNIPFTREKTSGLTILSDRLGNDGQLIGMMGYVAGRTYSKARNNGHRNKISISSYLFKISQTYSKARNNGHRNFVSNSTPSYDARILIQKLEITGIETNMDQISIILIE